MGGRGQRRLIERNLSAEEQNNFIILSAGGFSKNAICFEKDLAVLILERQDGKPVVVYSRKRDETTWKGSFFGHDEGKPLLREECLHIQRGNQCRFIHRSILEYGLA